MILSIKIENFSFQSYCCCVVRPKAFRKRNEMEVRTRKTSIGENARKRVSEHSVYTAKPKAHHLWGKKSAVLQTENRATFEN